MIARELSTKRDAVESRQLWKGVSGAGRLKLISALILLMTERLTFKKEYTKYLLK